MRLIGSYFEVTDRVPNRQSARTVGAVAGRVPDPRGAVASGERPGGEGGREGGGREGGELLISVAKRLVRSAVRRNTVKRIVREAWRAATRERSGAGRGNRQSSPRGTGKGIAHEDLQGSGQQGNGDGDDDHVVADALPRGPARIPTAPVCLVRLKRYPGSGGTGPAVARGPSSGAGGAVGTKSGLAMIKRSLRKDADELIAMFLSASKRPVRPSASPRSPRTPRK